MDSNTAWAIFERTGSINSYMLYKREQTKQAAGTVEAAAEQRSTYVNADQHQRDYSGTGQLR